MRRREFIGLSGGMAMWPFAARGQQAAMPVVGVLRSTPSAPFGHLAVALRQGLRDEGFIEGRNVAIEERWADNRLDRLPAFAADLVRRQAAVIVGNVIAIEAVRAAITAVPLVFVSSDDPVKIGLVANLNRPTGNLTGVTFFGGAQLNDKQLELMRDLVPDAAVVAVLGDSQFPPFEATLPHLESAARALGRQVVVAKVASDREFEPAFARLVGAGARALLVSGSPFFTSQRRAIIALAARHRMPAIYDQQIYVANGGLMSYGASITDAYRQAGIYAGRILKGARPADLPVMQPARFELAVNLGTARALGVSIPESIFIRADEVIE